MNALPTEMIDRWQNRPEPAPGEGLIYWHILLGDNPDIVALAKEAQQRLAQFPGLHLTPLRWLHVTLLIAGPTNEISEDQIRQMASSAGGLLAEIPPPIVTVGKILYHPEAIMLAAQPTDALRPVLEAVQEVTREATGQAGHAGNKLPWIPHITIAYSTAQQFAKPIISALGRSLPERKIQISGVSIVNQQGPERDWSWRSEATVSFPTSSLQVYSASRCAGPDSSTRLEDLRSQYTSPQ